MHDGGWCDDDDRGGLCARLTIVSRMTRVLRGAAGGGDLRGDGLVAKEEAEGEGSYFALDE